ncbi:MAG: hypothetical protein ABIK20_04410 [Candidatus Omnitrophota bacterium]
MLKPFKINRIIASFFLMSLILASTLSAAESGTELKELRKEMENLKQSIRDREEKLVEMEQKLNEIERRQEVTIPETISTGQSTSTAELPDISLIGNIQGRFGESPNNFSVNEIEFAVGGFLYPQIRADVYTALHKHDGEYEVELEEGYLSFLNLGGGFDAQIGKKLLNFGRLNSLHPHSWNFVERPVVLTEYLGDHGLAGNGVAVGYLLPLPLFSRIEVGAWRVDAPHEHDHEGMVTASPAGEIYTGRLLSSLPVSKKTDLEMGLSFLKGHGSHYEEHLDNLNLYGIDLTLRHYGPGYQRFLFRNEVIHNRREIPPGTQKKWGFYNELNWRWNKHWDTGYLYSWVEPPFPEEVREERKQLSLALTRSLGETNKIRFQVSHDLEGEFVGYLQFIFGIGPHSHPIE